MSEKETRIIEEEAREKGLHSSYKTSHFPYDGCDPPHPLDYEFRDDFNDFSHMLCHVVDDLPPPDSHGVAVRTHVDRSFAILDLVEDDRERLVARVRALEEALLEHLVATESRDATRQYWAHKTARTILGVKS